MAGGAEHYVVRRHRDHLETLSLAQWRDTRVRERARTSAPMAPGITHHAPSVTSPARQRSFSDFWLPSTVFPYGIAVTSTSLFRPAVRYGKRSTVARTSLILPP